MKAIMAYRLQQVTSNYVSCIGGVMVSMLASSVVDRGFDGVNPKTICCFSAKHTALRRKSKNWMARNQDNVSVWDDMSIRGLLSQWV